jgi:hypothetical protein
MFNIELIRKIFAYEHIYRKFDMVDFKILLRLEEKYGNQVKFKEWIDNNNLVKELKEWLKEYKLEKTFSEVYVIGKTDVEIFVDDLYKETDEEKRKQLVNDYMSNLKKKNLFD